MTPLRYLLLALLIFAVVTILYSALSKGLSRSARGQQATRYGLGSIIAVAPLLVGWDAPLPGGLWLAALIALGWTVTYPLLAWITNRRVSSDIDHYMDFASGLYIFSMLSALLYLVDALPACRAAGSVLVAVAEIIFLLPLVFQWGYFALYGGCIDDVGMNVVADTNTNEIIEFTRAYPKLPTLSVGVAVLLLLGGVVWVNVDGALVAHPLSGWQILFEGLCLALVLRLSFRPRKGALLRTEIVRLYLDTREYRRSTQRYRRYRTQIDAELKAIKPLGKKASRPSAILMVIGESASRDYMSAFRPQDVETTPWLSDKVAADGQHFMLVRNAYSCAFQTVPALERALTEKNQYNSKEYFESASIVDIARSLGYHVSWFSNQGHIGVADTSVSIVAETSHRAQWTHQEVGKVQYDHTLLDLLASVDPNQDNFIVLHLKGSHFNYLNRYPESETVWGEPGVQDNVVNYKNSIHYTDSVLRRAFEYARDHLNLQAMVYFSDHATIPDKHRSPRFDGFGQCRIPAFIYLSDSYIANHPCRYEAIRANKDRYFTNDLAYELMCGIFDVATPRFNEENCLLSDRYRFTRDMLLTYLGTKHISDDHTDDSPVAR